MNSLGILQVKVSIVTCNIVFDFLVSSNLCRCDNFNISTGITDYLVELRKPVERLQGRMQKTHQNLSEIRSIMSTWAKIPLFERKDGKKDSVLCLDERTDRITKRYADIESASKVVHG